MELDQIHQTLFIATTTTKITEVDEEWITYYI